MNEYGVDLVIWAHEHSYERLWPLYNYEVRNGSYEDPYRNPGAPVHIISGSAVRHNSLKVLLLERQCHLKQINVKLQI